MIEPRRRRRRPRAHADAERQRHRSAPDVWPDGNPNSTGPGNRRAASAMTDARGAAGRRGSSHRGNSPMTTAAARAEQPGLPQLRHHAIQPVRALGHFVEEQDVTRRRIERERRAERGEQLRERSAQQRCRPPRRAESSRAAGAIMRRRSARACRPASNDVAVVAGRAARQTAVEHRPVKRDDAAADRQAGQHRRDVAVADERLGRTPHVCRDRAAAAAARCRSRRARAIRPAIDGSAHAARKRRRAHGRRARDVSAAREDSLVVHGLESERCGSRQRRRRTPRGVNGLAGATTAMRSPAASARGFAHAQRSAPSRRRPPDARRGRGCARSARPARPRPRPAPRNRSLARRCRAKRVLDRALTAGAPARPRR